MRISTKGRYALRMMIDIAEHGDKGRVTIKDISERQEISIKYLEQIVLNLKRSGLLRSVRGSSGGYELAKKPAQYTVGEILRVIEGKLAPVACLEDEINQCRRKKICKTLSFWEGLYKVIDGYIDSFTLQDLINSEEADDAGDYSI
ncbi:MAG: RrF2 family transcriptional regulator [Oscillospiraceae bacterium]|nr:RrF2 family transcriptional regulator [Oscillospiraceae bacterium]